MTLVNGPFLDLFWELASPGVNTRVAAVGKLMTVSVSDVDASTAAYVLQRLVGGLQSWREGARAGCACALTCMLRHRTVSAVAVAGSAPGCYSSTLVVIIISM